jgi:hypothetical protein
MMEAIRSSETSVLTNNTRRKIPEDGFLQEDEESRVSEEVTHQRGENTAD